KRVNLTDLDCREQRKSGPGYNCQAAVDCDSQVIVCAEVVSTPVDNDQLLALINQVEADTNTVGHPKEVFADAGYESAANCVELEKKPHIDAYVASKHQDKQRNQPQPPFDKAGFHFEADKLQCICPLGHSMKLRQRREVDGVLRWDFIGSECPSCPSRKQCTKAEHRSVRIHSTDRALQRMRDKMDTDAGRRAMRFRKSTSEPVFGQLKECINYNGFSLRGMAKVQGEFTLMAIVHNLKKMHKFLSGRGLNCRILAKKQFLAPVFRIFNQFVLNRTFRFAF
ncbi:transposase, partial [bacterium]|nr:transposase [bacterium]